MIPVEATGNTDACWLLLPLEFELCHTEQVKRFERVLPDPGRALKYLHFQEPGPWLILVATIPGTPLSLGLYRCRCSSIFHFLKRRPTFLSISVYPGGEMLYTQYEPPVKRGNSSLLKCFWLYFSD